MYFIQCGNFHIKKCLLDMEASSDDFSLDFIIIFWTFRCRNCNWGRYPNRPSRKEPSVPEHRANLHFQTSNQHLKSTNAFLGGCKDFLFAVRTIRPDGIGSCHLSHLDLQSLSNKIFRLLDFKVECVDLELEPTNTKWQSEMAK